MAKLKTVKEIIGEMFGTQAEACRQLNVVPGCVSGWCRKNYFPAAAACKFLWKFPKSGYTIYNIPIRADDVIRVPKGE